MEDTGMNAMDTDVVSTGVNGRQSAESAIEMISKFHVVASTSTRQVLGEENQPSTTTAKSAANSIQNKSTKLFVLDTNVILHDWKCIQAFDENDVCVPLTVIEELDKFKRGNEELNYNAREFLRFIDELSQGLKAEELGMLWIQGISMGDNRGKFIISLETRDPEIERLFFHDSPDHRILSALAHYDRIGKEKYRQVSLVTKDVNLRMKARSLGYLAADYNSDHVSNNYALYTGTRVIEGVSSETISTFFRKEKERDGGDASPRLSLDDLKEFFTSDFQKPMPNENFVLRNCNSSVLATYSYDMNTGSYSFDRVQKRSAYGITPRNSEQVFALSALLDDSISLVTISGKAGTGKTLLAIAAALECAERYSTIYISRPVVPLSNRDSGYLPGDINTKLDPYMQPLFDNINVIKATNTQKNYQGKLVPNQKCVEIQSMLDTEKIKIAPLSYIRGRSFHDSFFIVDEAQNLTPHEVRTIITRAGERAKLVLVGDLYQIDNPYVDTRSNGLAYIIERMRGQTLYSHINLHNGERSQLASLASQLL